MIQIMLGFKGGLSSRLSVKSGTKEEIEKQLKKIKSKVPGLENWIIWESKL